jgi:predicted enzyme related to lactoylglutathione lyase
VHRGSTGPSEGTFCYTKLMDVLVNIDVPDLTAAIAFYTAAFGLYVSRRLGSGAAELAGWPARLYLLEKQAGSMGAGGDRRRYDRHWTPVHLDIVVDDLDATLERALGAGARAEAAVRAEAWGRIVGLTDPFGHGFCLIEFLGRGYDVIATSGEVRR